MIAPANELPVPARMRIHIVNPFQDAYGGSERRAIAIYETLRSRAEVTLWSEHPPHPALAHVPVRRISAEEGQQPLGGTLIVVGAYFPLGAWLERAKPDRAVLIYNTFFPDDTDKWSTVNALRRVSDPEIVYASRIVADWVGLPGTVHPSLIDIEAFSPAARAPGSKFTVGRLSRDVLLKHHPRDVALYRRLARADIRVRIMGGACLADRGLGGVEGIELLPAGAEPAPRFLQSLDCFFYRTSDDWLEPSGRVVSEAMSCGLPVVCARRGGYAESIEHGKTGFLFDTDEEAQALLLALRDDPALRRRIGDAARRKTEETYSASARQAIGEYFLAPGRDGGLRPRHIDFAWELGGHTGHVTTLLPIARTLKARGYEVRFLLREPDAAADLEGAVEIPREGAPIWSGPVLNTNPLNFGEILLNFGYHDPVAVTELIRAWRERLLRSHAVVANVAPAAHLAARTLGIPSFEISQGFHIPPPAMPSPPLRDWEPAPRAQLEAADRRVLHAINSALAAFGTPPIATIGEIFTGRAMLLTYPELDIYPERGPSEYFGIPHSGEGSATPPWPAGSGARVFIYLYRYYSGLDPLLDALGQLNMPTLIFCRGIDPALKVKYGGGSIHFSDEPMSVTRLLPETDIVVCHGSHQMTAQALLAGKPVLLLPTQLEQFLITRRVVRQGAGLGIAPEVANADFALALTQLSERPGYAEKAREFAQRYAGHDRHAALATMIARIEAALKR